MAPGAVFDDRHRLLALAGEGGYGAVWRALDPQTGRPVAVKFLKPSRRTERESRECFVRECHILRRLRHPNLARWISDRTGGDRPHLVMEWIDGVPLATLLLRAAQQNRSFTRACVAEWASDLVRGLSHAHAAGVVHCDLKPANVVRSPRGLVIVDFGSARLHRRPGWLADRRVIGTTSYLTPEQLRSESATWAADQFALATVLFETLTLHRAWFVDADGGPLRMDGPRPALAANEPGAVFARIQNGDRPSAKALRPDLPARVDAVLRRAWESRPEDRFVSMHAFLDAFREALLGPGLPEPAPLARSQASTLLCLRPGRPRAVASGPASGPHAGIRPSRSSLRRRAVGRPQWALAGAVTGVLAAVWFFMGTMGAGSPVHAPEEPRATPHPSVRPADGSAQPLSLEARAVTVAACDEPGSDCSPW